MAFPTKYLNDDERIVLDVHPHWWDLVWPGAMMVALFVLAIYSYSIANANSGDAMLLLETVCKWAAWLGTALAAIRLGFRALKWSRTHFVVTTERVIFREGVIARTGIEIPIWRVNNINFQQSIFERLIGAGDLLIESGGEDGMQVFNNVRDPMQVQSIIQRTMRNTG